MAFMFFLGMAHRDLKPENILCESADKVSLLQTSFNTIGLKGS